MGGEELGGAGRDDDGAVLGGGGEGVVVEGAQGAFGGVARGPGGFQGGEDVLGRDGGGGQLGEGQPVRHQGLVVGARGRGCGAGGVLRGALLAEAGGGGEHREARVVEVQHQVVEGFVGPQCACQAAEFGGRGPAGERLGVPGEECGELLGGAPGEGPGECVETFHEGEVSHRARRVVRAPTGSGSAGPVGHQSSVPGSAS